jgi:LDH2 family malate/lactate/ureidoglycolate dehydrogenase
MSENPGVRVQRAHLEDFCSKVFLQLGMTDQAAKDSAEILVAADARGIASHGIARLRRYVSGITTGVMKPQVQSEVVYRTPLSFVLDAKGGGGLSLSKQVMQEVIDTAKARGFATAAVRDSNHFGIAGYYAMMALPHDMIGVAMTNTAALGIPTFGRDVLFGTNPIAVAVPALHQPAYVLDMATTVVTRGKVEVYEREGKTLPSGWAVDSLGADTSDATALLEDMLVQAGGGILPLGGRGDELGGHKGFGLAVLVDILTAVTSGGVFGRSVMDSERTSARVCHYFAAIRLDMFRDPLAFRTDMDRMLLEIRNARPAVGQERVYYAGLKEYESELDCAARGVPLSMACWAALGKIAQELQVALPGTV